ncbi:hypothetical protein [Kitasatospora cheerisanensis]|uniref:hypothetical protein n=1 Tax=Kitasatospora cheerisanensis TaxID=81942 RepID=UPI003CC59628
MVLAADQGVQRLAGPVGEHRRGERVERVVLPDVDGEEDAAVGPVREVAVADDLLVRHRLPLGLVDPGDRHSVHGCRLSEVPAFQGAPDDGSISRTP